LTGLKTLKHEFEKKVEKFHNHKISTVTAVHTDEITGVWQVEGTNRVAYIRMMHHSRCTPLYAHAY
jgi:hypothetical protein